MPETVNERFDIAFAGECLEGFAPDEVRAALGKLFKADAATLDRLFSGKRQRVKRGCDKATALRYQQAMSNVGARPIVTRSAGEAPAAAPPEGSSATPDPAGAAAKSSPTPAPEANATTAQQADLSILPPGSDILTPQERHAVEPRELNLAHLSLAETGERLSDAQPPLQQSVQAPSLDVADLGSTLGPQTQPDVSTVPDISAIELAPEGHDLSDCSPAPAAPPDLDLDQLTLAPSGTELLLDEERQHTEFKTPDTSHLHLAEPSDK
jgi:pyruvate/2-oxoglutarate dehydrogenase complex dihydrolipoamide acyltransferase (E2) component